MNTETLDQLAHREPVAALWTDKRTRREGDGDYVLHGYLPVYEREWGKWRDEPIRILEIGLNVGASIKLWLEYFTKANVVGVDIEDFHAKRRLILPDESRFRFVQGDAMDRGFWKRFRDENEPFDIIIDDGAHSSGTIATSFDELWQHVKRGGYYAIEDFGEVNNPASHTPEFPDQVEFAMDLLARSLMGYNSVEQAIVFKELVLLKKKA